MDDRGYDTYTVPMRTARGEIVAAEFRTYPDDRWVLVTDPPAHDTPAVITVRRCEDGIVELDQEGGGKIDLVALSRVEALALIAMLRNAVYPERTPLGARCRVCGITPEELAGLSGG